MKGIRKPFCPLSSLGLWVLRGVLDGWRWFYTVDSLEGIGLNFWHDRFRLTGPGMMGVPP